MGEAEVKPKVEVKRASNKWRNRNHQGTPRTKVEEFKAPTVGLENDFFTVGAAKDAASFAEVQKKIARYVAVTFKAGGSMAQLAIERLETPSVVKAAEPILGENASCMEEKSGSWLLRSTTKT